MGSQQDRSNTIMGIEPAEPASSCDICLVVPPFDAINFPALGTAILGTMGAILSGNTQRRAVLS